MQYFNLRLIFLQITWLDGSGAPIESGVESSTEPVENTKRSTSVSRLTITAKKEDHNTTLTCQAKNPADKVPRSGRTSGMLFLKKIIILHGNFFLVANQN